MGQSTACRGRSFTIRCHTAGVMLALIFEGCSSKEPTKTKTQEPTPTEVVNPATAGTTTGAVTLDGTPPAPREIMLSGSPACANLHRSPLIYPEVVTGDHGALDDVIVYVKSGLEN